MTMHDVLDAQWVLDNHRDGQFVTFPLSSPLPPLFLPSSSPLPFPSPSSHNPRDINPIFVPHLVFLPRDVHGSSCEASGSSSDHSQENCSQRQCSELACLWREEGWRGRREGEGGLGRVFAWVVTVSLILTVCLSLCTGECRVLRSQGSSPWGVAV